MVSEREGKITIPPKGKIILEIGEHDELIYRKSEDYPLTLTQKDEAIKKDLEDQSVLIFDDIDKIRIKTGYHAGIREFSNFILKISPKDIGDIDLLGKLLTYCYTKDSKIYDSESIPFQKMSDHPLDPVIQKFLVLCNEIIKKGLIRKYVSITDNVPYLKGKLKIKQQIQNNMKFNMKFNCEYDEFTSNNLENRIILHTLKKCLVISKNNTNKTTAQILIHKIDRQVEDCSISQADFKKVQFTRLNRHYQIPLEISKYILEKTGMMNIKQLESQYMVGFMEDMPKLFERFLQKFFDNFPRLKVRPQYPHVAWKKNGKDDEDVDSDGKKIYPDFVIYEGELERKKEVIYEGKSKTEKEIIRENIRFIIDAKYKDDIRISDRYQLAFYIHEYGITNAFAICPTLENTFIPIEDQIVYNDSKKYTLKSEYQGISIEVRYINVNEFFKYNIPNRPKKEIENILKNIVAT